MADAPGCDYGKGIHIKDKYKYTETLIVTESAIDALSYQTYMKSKGRDFKSVDCLATGGVMKIEAVLNHVKANECTENVVLAFDNDEAGRKCAETVKQAFARWCEKNATKRSFCQLAICRLVAGSRPAGVRKWELSIKKQLWFP